MASPIMTRSLKRKQALSGDFDDNEPPLKSLKQDSPEYFGSPKFEASLLLEDVLLRPLKSQGPEKRSDGIDLGGAWVSNIRAVAVDASGKEYQPPVNAQGFSKYGLPTPDPTPLPQDANPFDKSDMRLFGLIPSKVYVYEHISDALHPYNEVVKIAPSGKVSLGSMWPSLEGSQWDAIALEDPILGFQEETALDGSVVRMSGLYFETDVVFQGALQPVSDLLRDFFGQHKPAIRLSTWLSAERHYGEAFCPTSIVLRGSLENVSVNVLDILTFREIGTELSGYQSYSLSQRKTVWNFGYGFFGKLDLQVPGTVLPLQVTYHLSKQFQSWVLQIHLKDDEWTDIFGIRDLNLTDVALQARLDNNGSKDGSLSVGIEADLELRNTKFGVRGYYSKDFYAVEAHIGNLSLKDVGEIFHELVGIELDVFDHDVLFRAMSLCISSEGLELKGEVTVNGHTSASGGLRLSRDGIAVHGGLGDVEFEQVTIKEASLDVFIASKLDSKSAQASKVDIFGHVSIHGVDVKAALHTDKAQEGEFHWTIYGEVEGDVTTSKIVPDLKDTFLDISLNRLALIASNHEAPSGSYTGINYPVAKGLQFCASIDRIPELEQLFRGSVKGMIFRATLTDEHFGMSIILPAERTITFGDNIYTGPLMIEVARDGAEFSLILKSLLNVKVDTQPDPLKFSLGLKASLSGASAYAQMVSDWINPCNIGKQVTVRGCALEFGIIYTTFFTTGMPGSIGMGGQIKIGNKEAKLAMKLSQNPKEQILAAAVKDLGVVDLVRFASQICEYEIPEPDDFLHFNDVQLYLSTGASIAETYYPPGASLKGDMTVFGKRARFECTISSMVKIMATIEQFDLGPLTVKGATGSDPIVDIELSSSKQKVLIDGAVELWALSAALHLEAEVYPKPKFDFWVDVSLSDWFKFKLGAKLTGDINFKDLKSLANADFAISGLMEQHILDKIIDMLDKQINSMHENADFDQAKKRLSEKEEAFGASVQAARSALASAKATWEMKEHNLLADLTRAQSEASAYLQKLRDDNDIADKSFANAVAASTALVEEARHDEAVALLLAEADLQRAQSESDETIREAQNELHRKRDAYDIAFGSARADLERVRKDVNVAQLIAMTIDKELADLDQRISDAPILDLPLLVAEKAVKAVEQAAAGAALVAAQAVLDAAELLVQGSEFIAAETAIAADKAALEGTLQAQTLAMAIAQATFEKTRTSHQVLVQHALKVLEDAQTNSQEQQTCKQARDLLAAGAAVTESMVSPAQKAYDGRETCAEFLAVAIAEKALTAAEQNSLEVDLARQACELVEQHSSSFADDILEVGLNIGKWIASTAAELINITKIEFSGSISSLVADGPPLIVKIEGKLVGQEINIDIHWQPHFNLAAFIKRIFSELWEKIKSAAGAFLENIGAKIVEIVEDVVEAVEEVAEKITEGVEKVGEALGEAASEVGHAVEQVAEEVDEVMSDVGHAVEGVAEDVGEALIEVGDAINDAASDVGHAVEGVVEDVDEAISEIGDAINDAASDVGHAVEDVIEDVDEALSEVGDAINGAASDVGHAFEHAADSVGNAFNDAGNDIGNAFNDAGHTVENVVSDIGSTISGWFD